LAGEWIQEPAYADVEDYQPQDIKKLNACYNEYGGYPCLALKLVEKEIGLAQEQDVELGSLPEKEESNPTEQVAISTPVEELKDEPVKETKVEKKLNATQIKRRTWNERSFKEKVQLSLAGLKKGNFTSIDKIEIMYVINFVFLIPVLGIDKLERKFKTEQE
jgi:hypothetical protein